MLKYILLSSLMFWALGLFLSHASYTPLSKQINVKTMQAWDVQYVISKRTQCVWTCRNRSSNSSYGGSSFGGK